MPPEDDKDKDKDKGTGKEPTLTDAVRAIQILVANSQAQEKTIKTLLDRVDKAEKLVMRPPGDAPDKKVPLEDKELERMTRKEFMDTIFKEAETRFVKPVQADLQARDEARASEETKRQIKETAEKYDDFFEFSDDIKEVLKDHPDLDIEKAYLLARSVNTDKASAIDAKAAAVKAEAEKKEKEAKDAEDKKGFGGLLPTSGVATKSQNMDIKDAAVAAWDQVGLDAHLAAISEASR